MIVALVHNYSTANQMLKSASSLSRSLDKKFGITISSDSTDFQSIKAELMHEYENLDYCEQFNKLDNIAEICQHIDASFLFIQPTSFSRRKILRMLYFCRDLRIPYLIFNDKFHVVDFRNVVVPVNFLIEEIEKAQFAAAFGRFCNAKITLLQAKDYGQRSKVNTERIGSVLDKFGLDYNIEIGNKDSFKIEFDAIGKAATAGFGLVIASASREYGLDDIFFGPKELHLIKKSPVPVMLINPRGDLYTLCD